MKRKIMVLLLCALMLAATFGFAGSVSAEQENVDKKATRNITMESGTTNEAFDGGAYRLVKFGSDSTGIDSAFGVLWGTEGDPGSITILMTQARYLGVADVINSENGQTTRSGMPLKVHTVQTIKLGDIFEFDDVDGDGICDYARSFLGAVVQAPDAVDTLFNKKVSLNTAWEASDVEEYTSDDGSEKSYTFTLTATDLEYEKIWPLKPLDPSAEGQALEKVEFQFTLKAYFEDVEGVEIPRYRIEVRQMAQPDQGSTAGQGTGSGGTAYTYEFENAERVGTKSYSGKRAQYDVKWNHTIEGWDYSPNNQNSGLHLEFRAMLANAIPPGTEEWFQNRFMQKIGEDGAAQYQYQYQNGTTGVGVSNSTDPEPTRSRYMNTNRIEFGGDWSKAGRFTWVSDVDVDGTASQMKAQVMGGRQVTTRALNGASFSGFAVWGGFSYPGGEEIFHDPGIDGAVLDVSVASPDDESSGILGGLAGGIGLAGIAGVALLVLVIAAVAVGRRRGPQQSYQESYDRLEDDSEQGDDNDWNKYY